MNAVDVDGNTCLHLCITTMAERINWRSLKARMSAQIDDEDGISNDLEEEERVYEDVFDKLKEIGKELLFAGASRDV